MYFFHGFFQPSKSFIANLCNHVVTIAGITYFSGLKCRFSNRKVSENIYFEIRRLWFFYCVSWYKLWSSYWNGYRFTLAELRTELYCSKILLLWLMQFAKSFWTKLKQSWKTYNRRPTSERNNPNSHGKKKTFSINSINRYYAAW